MQTYPTLYTNRLLLEPITPSDVHRLFRQNDAAYIKSYFGVDEEGFAFLSEMNQKGMETFSISVFFFLLRIRETGRPIGECGFHTWSKKHRRAELFYLLRNDSDKQQGYMSEALPEVIRFGIEVLGLQRLEAGTASWNIPSTKLIQKNGFEFERIAKQHYWVNGIFDDTVYYVKLIPPTP